MIKAMCSITEIGVNVGFKLTGYLNRYLYEESLQELMVTSSICQLHRIPLEVKKAQSGPDS